MSMEQYYKDRLAEEKEESALLWEVCYKLEAESCHDRHRAGLKNNNGYTCIENQEGDGGPIDKKLLCSRCLLTRAYVMLDVLEGKRLKARQMDELEYEKRLGNARDDLAAMRLEREGE